MGLISADRCLSEPGRSERHEIKGCPLARDSQVPPSRVPLRQGRATNRARPDVDLSRPLRDWSPLPAAVTSALTVHLRRRSLRRRRLLISLMLLPAK